MAKKEKDQKKKSSFGRRLFPLAMGAVMAFTPLIFTGCSNGQDGKNGVDGTKWYSGLDYAEVADVAKTGDFFIETDAYILWKLGANGQWEVVMENYGKPGNDSTSVAKDIEVANNGGILQWRYKTGDDTAWKTLIDTSTLQGAAGTTPHIDETTGNWFIGTQDTGVKAEATNGNDGKTVEVANNSGVLQWRYTTGTDTAWKNLVTLSTLEGTDGKEVEFQKGSTHIQWRYEGDASWQDLIAIADLKGTNGTTPHIDATSGNWFIGTTDTDVSALPKQVEIAVNGEEGSKTIQWRYTTGTDTAWKNLISLADLKGADGATWLSGTEVSVSTLNATVGKEGDFYLNTTNYDIFKKGATAWVKIGNIKGSDGQDGTDVGEIASSTYMHISFDDVEKCLSNLQNKTYSSMWEEPFFAWLKNLHDTTGAKFSLYAYNSALTSLTKTDYADEFYAAKDWLKIGLHAANSSGVYTTATYEQGKNDWNSFVNNVIRITGSYLSVDRMPRLHTFAGSEEALKGMRDANYGALGFLSADDSRTSYYFTDNIKTYLYDNNHITDNKNGLVFVATDMRADWFNSSFSSSNNYKAPTKDNVYDELVYRYTTASYANSVKSYIFFGHEWDMYNGTSITTSIAKRYEDACKFANDYGIDFDYSENRNFNPTPYDIYSAGTTTETPDNGDNGTETPDVEDEVATTATFDGTTLNIVDVKVGEGQTQDITYVEGFSIGGSSHKYSTTTGRALSKTEVLKLDTNKQYKLTIDQTKTSQELEYSIYAYNSETMNATSNVNPSTVSLGSWTSNDVTLNMGTKYLILVFRYKNATSTAISTEDLALLNQAVTFTVEGELLENQTMYGNMTMTIVENLSEMEFVDGVSLTGGSEFTTTTTTGRAVATGYVLKVNGGETLTLNTLQDLTLRGFAIKEFTDKPLNASTLTSSGETFMAWIENSVTLQSDTKYIVIGFAKPNSDLTSFTADQLELLKTALTITSAQ